MKILLIFLCSFCISAALAQHTSLESIEAPTDFENVHVEQIAEDSLSSAFLIFVKHKVGLHYHDHHTENVYVLDGTGEMILGSDTFRIAPGDHIFIPEKTPHAVKVLSSTPLKVLSVQSPQFDGSDRILLE